MLRTRISLQQREGRYQKMKSVVLRMIRKGYACMRLSKPAAMEEAEAGVGVEVVAEVVEHRTVSQLISTSKNQIEDIERLSVVADTTADSVTTARKDADKPVVTFDLNVQLNEDGESTLVLAGAPSDSSEKPSPGTIHEEISLGGPLVTWKGWLLMRFNLPV